jgi:two-component sensor histidine kinase
MSPQASLPVPEGQNHALVPDSIPLEFLQLRHLTKNTLQRIMCEIEDAARLQDSQTGLNLVSGLQRRIQLSAMVSDALFGLTREPSSFAARLSQLCEASVQLLAPQDLTIRLTVQQEGECPAYLRDTVLRIAHELVGNAIKHGMYQRLLGNIDIQLSANRDRVVRLVVADDGWGLHGPVRSGQGLSLVEELMRPHLGKMTLRRVADRTQVEVSLRSNVRSLDDGKPVQIERIICVGA